MENTQKPAAPGCNLRPVVPGRFYRSDALTGVSPETRSRVEALGLTRFVDLRSPAERASHPCDWEEEPGVEYHAVDLSGGLKNPGDTAWLGTKIRDLGDLYCGFLDRCRGELAAILRLLAGAPGPALFHCSAGKDRTGVVAMLVLGVAGASEEEILDDYLATKEAIVPLMPFLASAEAIQKGGAAALAFLETEAAFLEAALARIRESGGFEGYVRESLGLTNDEIHALRVGSAFITSS